MKRLLVVETGDPVPPLLSERGPFHRWMVAGLGLPEVQIDALRVHEGAPLPSPAICLIFVGPYPS